ncbi:hypothetical protein [Brevibacillus sp. SIMBA_040]|uniref:hypothetical protein n=1 Tax=unclassified Brevibacillus TaxID=2684853 RepID=UPI0039798ED4
MIDVSEVITDPDFAQTYTVHRKAGEWIRGDWVPSDETPLKMTGPVIVADAETLEQIPEGDRVTGLMCFYSTQELFESGDGNAPIEGTTDVVEWKGNRYKLIKVFPYGDYGFYKAVGQRKAGD